ncbi:DUF1697 domain-containing protein [Streptomyces sp. NPDC060194]|uniref:DUF1697 domain-containing protein n=1 Tax=Streptomyces sp. NPDC060194 TaxID=3347069 RepID=UPI00364D81F8
MANYAALLRGVNVGGGRKVPMAEWRTLLEGLGHTDVRTYLNSGNAVFASGAGADPDVLAAGISHALAGHFGFPVDVLVRTAAELQAVIDQCPFPADELEPKQLHVTYFDRPVGPERFGSLDLDAFRPEECRLGERVLYLYAPDGLGRSKLAEALSKPALQKGVVATSRNWNTVRKLAELTGGGGPAAG